MAFFVHDCATNSLNLAGCVALKGMCRAMQDGQGWHLEIFIES
jgi:hypothetical protein